MLLDSIRLEDTGSLLSRLPIGEFWFPPDESYCVVALPMSGDVVLLGTRTFEILESVHLGREPLDAVALMNGDVYGRDWQTRTLLRGRRST